MASKDLKKLLKRHSAALLDLSETPKSLSYSPVNPLGQSEGDELIYKLIKYCRQSSIKRRNTLRVRSQRVFYLYKIEAQQHTVFLYLNTLIFIFYAHNLF